MAKIVPYPYVTSAHVVVGRLAQRDVGLAARVGVGHGHMVTMRR
ncbi:hypothetical protein [Actinoplanes sp. NPDC049316]